MRGDPSECKTTLNVLKSFFLLKRVPFEITYTRKRLQNSEKTPGA
jgi:hypothetical protein